MVLVGGAITSGVLLIVPVGAIYLRYRRPPESLDRIATMTSDTGSASSLFWSSWVSLSGLLFRNPSALYLRSNEGGK